MLPLSSGIALCASLMFAYKMQCTPNNSSPLSRMQVYCFSTAWMPTSSSSTAVSAAFDAACGALQVFGRYLFCLSLAEDDPHMICCHLRIVKTRMLPHRKVPSMNSTQLFCPAKFTSAFMCHRMAPISCNCLGEICLSLPRLCGLRPLRPIYVLSFLKSHFQDRLLACSYGDWELCCAQIPLEFANCCRLRQTYPSGTKDGIDVAPKLVACGNAMYLFGGVNILENGQSVPSNGLYIFEPKHDQGGDISRIMVTKVLAGEGCWTIQLTFMLLCILSLRCNEPSVVMLIVLCMQNGPHLQDGAMPLLCMAIASTSLAVQMALLIPLAGEDSRQQNDTVY